MRLIDGDKIGLTDFEIIMCNGNYKEALKMLLNKIEDAPTIEQPEIIHCRDCKHKFGSACDNFAEVWVSQNDYCSRAERKEDNNETN